MDPTGEMNKQICEFSLDFKLNNRKLIFCNLKIAEYQQIHILQSSVYGKCTLCQVLNIYFH